MPVGTSGHGDMNGLSPLAFDSMPMTDAVVGPGIVTTPTVDPGSGGNDHGAMAECVLFLVAVGVALMLLLLQLRIGQGTAGIGRFAGIAATDIRRRGPPSRWPRLALCVIRV